MGTARAATHNWKAKVQVFEKSTARRFKEVQIKLTQWSTVDDVVKILAEAWLALETAYEDMIQKYPDVEEPGQEGDVAVEDTYVSRREWLDKALLAHDRCKDARGHRGTQFTRDRLAGSCARNYVPTTRTILIVW